MEKQSFQAALHSIYIPPKLSQKEGGDGVPVWQVSYHGKIFAKTLKLGEDKFTIQLLPIKNTNEQQSGGVGGLLKRPSILRFRNRSTSSSGTGILGFGTDSSSYYSVSNYEKSRTIDIGAIDRIQRSTAHDTNLGTTTTTASATNTNTNTNTNTITTPTGIEATMTMNDNNSSSNNRGNNLQQQQQQQWITPDRSFSIIFKGEPTLDLMAENKVDRDEIVNILDKIIYVYKEAKEKVANDVLLMRYVWLDTKTDTVNVNQISSILTRINVNYKKNKVVNSFNKFRRLDLNRNSRQKGGFTLEQTCTFVHMFAKRDSWVVKPINTIWNTLFGEIMNNGKQRQTVSDKTFLEKFLHRKQGQVNATIMDVHDIFKQLRQIEIAYMRPDMDHSRGITREQFEVYLLSNDNDAFDGVSEQYDERSMFKPISEYWINSSHNTYLTGDQFTSQSSVEMYLHALYRGCRCIELDIWDGGYEPPGGAAAAAATAAGGEIYDFGTNSSSSSTSKVVTGFIQFTGFNSNNSNHNDSSAANATNNNNSNYNNNNNNPDGATASAGVPVPVVWHGHTMTSKILFVDIIKVIKLFLNFHPDTFPIVLSFENHCSIPYQEVMAEQLVDILGDSLYMPTEASLLNSGKLPSPMELRGLVVIKGKRPQSVEAELSLNELSNTAPIVSKAGKCGDTGNDDDSVTVFEDFLDDYSDGDESDTEYDNNHINNNHRTNPSSSICNAATVAAFIGEKQLPPIQNNSNKKKTKGSKNTHGVSPALARLTTFHGYKHKNWDESIRNPKFYMHSFSENKVRSLCKSQSSSSHHSSSSGSKKDSTKYWAIYNQSHMTRTYPAGSRLDSSNYSPFLAWSQGCQMVSLNFQTNDMYIRSNDGRFRENGNCGYVLKPSSLMLKLFGDIDQKENLTEPMKLSIRILSGSCIPKPKPSYYYYYNQNNDESSSYRSKNGTCIDPYVKITVFDVKNVNSETVTSYNTQVCPGNGFFPIWNSEEFNFNIENESVAILQLTVYDRKDATNKGIVEAMSSLSDDFIASSSIPISCLRKGIRSVKLFDTNNSRSGPFDFATLLIDAQLQRAIEEI